MAAVRVRADNSIPINVGWHYHITPGGASANWVEVTDIVNNKIYVRGLDNTIAEWTVPKWKFDDLVSEYQVTGYYILTEDGLYILGDEEDDDLLWM